MNRTYKQLHRYLDSVTQSQGYLILIELKNSDTIPWEQLIKWTEMEYESMGCPRGLRWSKCRGSVTSDQ